MKILLAGISTRGLAESAVRSGYTVIALDAFGDLDQKEICECYSLERDFGIKYSVSGLYEISHQFEFEALAYTSNLENHPEVVCKFERHANLLGNPSSTLQRARNWSALFKLLKKAGFRTPDTIIHGNGRRPDQERLWLQKPVNSGGGHGIGFAQANLAAERDFILQEYIPGYPCSTSFVSNGERAVVMGVSEQLIGRPEFGIGGFRYCGNLVPLAALQDEAQRGAILNQVWQIANLLTRSFGLVGVNGFDFILNDGKVCPLEVNPRYSASMELIEKAYHLTIFDLHLRAVTRGELPEFNLNTVLQSDHQRFYGKAILFAERDAQAPDTRSWLNTNIRDIPHPGEQILSGKPICTVLAEGSSRETCLAQLVAGIEAIKGEIYD